jgi:hypothetical protein
MIVGLPPKNITTAIIAVVTMVVVPFLKVFRVLLLVDYTHHLFSRKLRVYKDLKCET